MYLLLCNVLPPSTVSCIQHAISVSELPGLLQTTNYTLVLYSFALSSVSFFMLLIIPFMQSLFQNYLVCYRQPIPHWFFIHLLYAVFVFFMLLIIPFIAHLIGSYHTASIPLCAFHYTHFQQHCTPICFLKRFFSFFRKITPFKFISLFQERTSLKFPAIWVAGSTTTRLLLWL